MIEPIIICPNCSIEIKVTESLAAPLIQATRKKYETKIAEKEADVSKREAALRGQQKAVADAKKAIDEQVAERLDIERKSIAEEAGKKAKSFFASDLELKARELTEIQEILETKNEKLEEAQKNQADLMRKQRELDDSKRELELTVEKRVQESITEVREKVKKEVEGDLKLKVLEKEEQISSMQNKIEELKRKAEQGSQQLQGEVMELELEDTLRYKFPFDTIEPIAKGEFGGDVIQRVVSPMGLSCGAILWESKRTKNWSDSWLAKLRKDQRSAKAEISVLVSQTLPKNVESFSYVDGIWVTALQYAFPLVISLRQTLIEVANSKQAQEGQQTKMELVYDYLTSPRFRHRIEAIVEKFSDMQADLEREKKAMTRLWAKRDMQIQKVIESTVGMYGDLQGIAGRAFQEIEGLEVQLIGSDISEDQEKKIDD